MNALLTIVTSYTATSASTTLLNLSALSLGTLSQKTRKSTNASSQTTASIMVFLLTLITPCCWIWNAMRYHLASEQSVFL